MPHHRYDPHCGCSRCRKEGRRREAQSTAARMLEWRYSRTRRRARVASEYWDAYKSGRPMSEEDR